MTDKWLIEDVEKAIHHRNRVVIVDPKGAAVFLLPKLEKEGYILLKTNPEYQEEWQQVKEALFLRYEAESTHKSDKVVFYAQQEQSKLSFLYDYCFTHGCIDLSNMAAWLSAKIFDKTGLQVNKSNEDLLNLAKISVGKDLNWWQKVLQDLEEAIQLKKEILPFLYQPDAYLKSYDDTLQTAIKQRFFDLIGQPAMKKKPTTLAKEVAHFIFDQLLANKLDKDLMTVYKKWIDSHKYSAMLKDYLSSYTIDPSIDVWTIPPEHSFEQVDRLQLEDLTTNFRDKTYLKKRLSKVKKRAKVSHAPTWWNDIMTLMTFDTKNLSQCRNLESVVKYYTEHFYQVDRAIRNIYAAFLQEESIVRPLQEYYEALNNEVLQHWFEAASDYISNQQGLLIDLVKRTDKKTAIIVGDGVRYEIAAHVAAALDKQCNIVKNIILADMPSETEHNMSALYVGNNEVIPIHKDREKRLSEITGKTIDYLNLESLHRGIESNCLVLTYKDIDSAGEKLQQGAIKLFSEFEKVLIEKIELLLKMGYEVHLVTDHGFVLTGILDEANKIDTTTDGKKEVHERFLRTVEKQYNNDWLCFDKKYKEYNYIYVAKRDKPFKSRGVYGFSHGGFTPQEVIIPHFIFQKEQSATTGLAVQIINKSELSAVTGDFFAIKLNGTSKKKDLFTSSRKVQILLYANSEKVDNSSILTIDANKAVSLEFSFGGKDELKAILIDATTQEQVDSVMIKKSNARDLGGLF